METFYVEGLGSPALEYMLCSNAVRMAQSKGLHRQPSKSWGLPECEILHRTWLFWAIYCCDKQIAFRSGRPSAIDDDNISCKVPTKLPTGSTADVEIFTAMVRHAQISSQISKRLMSVKAFQQSPTEFLASVSDLHAQLQQFRESLPTAWRPGTPIMPSDWPGSGARVTQMLYLHFAYYGSLIATNVLLTYPWISGRFGSESDPSFRGQANLSSLTVANAARNIILNTRAIEINAATPAFLAFYYPILSHINLFIFVLRHTSLATVDSDVALLDTCAGHFAYMEYTTSSELAFPFVRDAAALARNTVKRARETHNSRNGVGASNAETEAIGNGYVRRHDNAMGDASSSSCHELPDFPDAVLDEVSLRKDASVRSRPTKATR